MREAIRSMKMNIETFEVDKIQRALDNLELVRLFGIDDPAIDSESVRFGLDHKLYTQQDLVKAHQYSIQNKIDHYSKK